MHVNLYSVSWVLFILPYHFLYVNLRWFDLIYISFTSLVIGLVAFCLWNRCNCTYSTIELSVPFDENFEYSYFCCELTILADHKHIHNTWNCIYGGHYVRLHNWCRQCWCFEGKDSHYGGILLSARLQPLFFNLYTQVLEPEK